MKKSAPPVLQHVGAAAFRFDGRLMSLAALLAANADDEWLCAWARTAQAGDVFDAHGGPVTAVESTDEDEEDDLVPAIGDGELPADSMEGWFRITGRDGGGL